MTQDNANTIIELLDAVAKEYEEPTYRPDYVAGIDGFAVRSGVDIPARLVSAIAERLKASGFTLARWDVLDVSDGEVLLLKIVKSEAQS